MIVWYHKIHSLFQIWSLLAPKKTRWRRSNSELEVSKWQNTNQWVNQVINIEFETFLSLFAPLVERDAALEAASYPWDIEFQLSGHPLSPSCCHCHHEVRKLPLERQGPQNITVKEAHRRWQGTLGISTELQTLSLPLMCSLEHDWRPVVGF